MSLDRLSAGRPLEGATRGAMETLFGQDLGEVRIHTGARAESSAQALGARAYALGNHIAFNAGEYRPTEPRGGHLLAHEVAHVLQARGAGARDEETRGFDSAPRSAAAEHQAARMAATVSLGARVTEQPLPARRIHLTPQTGPTATPRPTSAPAPKGLFGKRASITLLLERWSGAGLLDPPFRPEEVPPIPQVPEPGQSRYPDLSVEAMDEELNQLFGEGGSAAMMGGLQPALDPGFKPGRFPPFLDPGYTPPPVGGPPVRTPVQTPTELPIGRGPTTTPGYRPRGPSGVGILAWGIPIALALAPYIGRAWLKSEHPEWFPDWEGKVSPVTGTTIETVEEFAWLEELTREQVDYLAMLYEARTSRPEPEVEAEMRGFVPSLGMQKAVGLALEAAQREKKKESGCFEEGVPRRTRWPPHDAYAMKVSGWGVDRDYLVGFGGEAFMISIFYDAMTPGTEMVWEVKLVGGWWYNADFYWLVKQALALAGWWWQRDLGLLVAHHCGKQLVWAIGPNDESVARGTRPNRMVARQLNAIWGGRPPVRALER